MELKSLVRVNVFTLSNDTPSFQVAVHTEDDKVIIGKELYNKTFKELGLPEKHYKYFSIFIGKGEPLERVREGDSVSISEKDFCIRKWIFDLSKEKCEVIKDEVAVHLLFSEAKREIERGKLKPDKSQKKKLQEFLDPKFCMEIQYLKLCQALPYYYSVLLDSCKTCQEYKSPQNEIEEGTSLKLLIAENGLEFYTDKDKYLVLWHCIKSWTKDSNRQQIIFEIGNSEENTVDLGIHTKQYSYLVANLHAVIAAKQTNEDDEEEQLFFTSMVHHLSDNRINFENSLFSKKTSVEIPNGLKDLTL